MKEDEPIKEVDLKKMKRSKRRKENALLFLATLIPVVVFEVWLFGPALLPFIPLAILASPIVPAVIGLVCCVGFCYLTSTKTTHNEGYSKDIKRSNVDKELKEAINKKAEKLVAENKNVNSSKVKTKSKRALVRYKLRQNMAMGVATIGVFTVAAGVMLFRPEILGLMGLAISLNPIIALAVIGAGAVLLVGGAFCFAYFRHKHIQELNKNTHEIVNKIVKDKVEKRNEIENKKTNDIILNNQNHEKSYLGDKNKFVKALNKENFTYDRITNAPTSLNLPGASVRILIPRNYVPDRPGIVKVK